MGEKTQKAHIRAIKDFEGFLKCSPDTATPEELRAYQFYMSDTGIAPPTFNARVMALRFLSASPAGAKNSLKTRNTGASRVNRRWF